METFSFVIVREDVFRFALEGLLDLDTKSHNFSENAVINHHLLSVTVYYTGKWRERHVKFSSNYGGWLSDPGKAALKAQSHLAQLLQTVPKYNCPSWPALTFIRSPLVHTSNPCLRSCNRAEPRHTSSNRARAKKVYHGLARYRLPSESAPLSTEGVRSLTMLLFYNANNMMDYAD